MPHAPFHRPASGPRSRTRGGDPAGDHPRSRDACGGHPPVARGAGTPLRTRSRHARHFGGLLIPSVRPFGRCVRSGFPTPLAHTVRARALPSQPGGGSEGGVSPLRGKWVPARLRPMLARMARRPGLAVPSRLVTPGSSDPLAGTSPAPAGSWRRRNKQGDGNRWTGQRRRRTATIITGRLVSSSRRWRWKFGCQATSSNSPLSWMSARSSWGKTTRVG